MATQSSSDAAFVEHYITQSRNSSKAEDCILLPKGFIANMASGSRFLKPAEKSDGGKKTSHAKMAASHGTSNDEGREVRRKREHIMPITKKSPSICGKPAPRKENWCSLVTSWSLSTAEDQPGHTKKRVLLVNVGECKSEKCKIPNWGDKVMRSGSKNKVPLKNNHLVCLKKSSRHVTSNAVREKMELRTENIKQRKVVSQFDIWPDGGDNKNERKIGHVSLLRSNTVLLRKYFLLWHKFVVLQVLKSIRAKNFAKERLLRQYFLMWRKSVEDKRMTLCQTEFLNNSNCSVILRVDAYYSQRLLSKCFHRWKWWTRWHQRRASRERKDINTTKKIEVYFSQQCLRHDSLESRNLVMEVPPCMSSSTHIIMDALREVRRQGYFAVPDVTLPPPVLFQQKSKIEKVVLGEESSTEIKPSKPPYKPFKVTTSKIEKSPRGKRPRSIRSTTTFSPSGKTKRRSVCENKGQQMIRAMDLRAAERKKRLAALMQKKKEAAEEKLAMERKKREAELELEKIEKRRRREAYEERMRARILQAIEKLNRHQINEENTKLAQQHYFHNLKQYVMRHWRAYVAYRSGLVNLAQEYRKNLALAYGIRLWVKLSFQRNDEKEAIALGAYHIYLKKTYFRKWKDFQMVHHILEAFADRHFVVKFGRKLLQAWHLWCQTQLPLRHAQEKKADELLNRKLLAKMLRHWTELPKIIHAERIRGERLNKLRERVQELLPDFSPRFDKIVLTK